MRVLGSEVDRYRVRLATCRHREYFGFFSETGENIFKIYLGRNEKRELIADQVERFKALKEQA